MLILFLVSLFLFNIFGYYFVFSYNQYIIRGEMRGLIRAGTFEKSCSTLQIYDPRSNPDFEKINKNEFRYKGVLYDVISEQIAGHIVIYKCIIDIQEEKLISGFHRSQEYLGGQNNPARTRHTAAMLFHLITLALIEISAAELPRLPSEIKFSHPVFSLFSVPAPPNSPPPKSS